jgi:hypothetical protein
MKIGDRVRLTGKIVNKESSWMPVEEGMKAGLEGTIVHLMLEGPKEYHYIGVKWDNGTSLGIFPSDPFELIAPETTT